MSQDNKKSFVMYQGNGSNNVFSVPMTKGKYGTISVAFVRRGLDQYEYNPTTWGLNGGLYAWSNGGATCYTDTDAPAIGANVYDRYGVDTGNTVAAIGGATITVNTTVYTRNTLGDVDENTVLTWTGATLNVGDYIVIERNTTLTQPFEFVNNQKHIEKSDDNQERQIQELADKIDSALRIDPTYLIDSNKMNPIRWLNTIIRCVDFSVRALRYNNGWLDYSSDDPNIADADKNWAHLLNTDNIKSMREEVVVNPETLEESHNIYYTDQYGVERLLNITEDTIDIWLANAIDQVTIIRNDQSKLEVQAVINRNTTGDTPVVYDWVGTMAEYVAQDVAAQHPEWLCYITDDMFNPGDTYVFEQGEAATTWNVVHNLNKYPSVTVVDSAGTTVDCAVIYINSNECELRFNAAFKGSAYLN